MNFWLIWPVVQNKLLVDLTCLVQWSSDWSNLLSSVSFWLVRPVVLSDLLSDLIWHAQWASGWPDLSYSVIFWLNWPVVLCELMVEQVAHLLVQLLAPSLDGGNLHLHDLGEHGAYGLNMDCPAWVTICTLRCVTYSKGLSFYIHTVHISIFITVVKWKIKEENVTEGGRKVKFEWQRCRKKGRLL